MRLEKRNREEVKAMRCMIEKCPNNTEAVTRLCLEHECKVWAMVQEGLNGGRAEKARP